MPIKFNYLIIVQVNAIKWPSL